MFRRAFAAGRTPLLSSCGHRRNIWNETGDTAEVAKAEHFYDSTIEKYAAEDLEVLTLQKMLKFGQDAWASPEKVLKSARFVQRELPKRLAQRLLDLQLLPFIVVTNPHIKKVYQSYYHAFETLRRLPTIASMEDNARFTLMLRRLVDEHTPMLDSLATGLRECKSFTEWLAAPMLESLATGLRECKSKQLVGPQLRMDPFLDSMLRSRISRRVIAEQHLHLQLRREGYIGIIETNLRLRDAIEFAAQRAAQVCTETYGVAPEVKVSGEVNAVLPYIATHLDYMLYELIKNSMRATVEVHHRVAPGNSTLALPQPLPAVQARICGGTASVTLRISDQGGGIPPHQQQDVWCYGFTTMQTREDVDGADAEGPPGLGKLMRAAADAGPQRFRMGGLGFGLPMSRLYARYFGGDLTLQSIAGYGVDAFLTLRRLEEYSWSEQLEKPLEAGHPQLLPQHPTLHAIPDSWERRAAGRES